MDSISQVDLASGVVFVGTFVLLYMISERRSRNNENGKKLPPSLPSIPIVGSMPFLDRPENLHGFFLKKALEIGDVYTAQLAKNRVLIVNGRRAIQEALIKRSTDFASRPVLPISVLFNAQLSGIVEHRFDADFRRYHQLCLTILKQFGFGSGAMMETRILVEVEDLTKKLKALDQGNSIHPGDLVTKSVMNIIASLVFGTRYSDGDHEADKLIMITDQFIHKSIDACILNFFPWLIHLPHFKRLISSNYALQDELNKTFEQKIFSGCMEDANDSFVKTFVEMEGEGYDRQQLLYIIRDLILASTETTSTTIQWALVMLANYPEVQERLAREINLVVPRTRFPSLNDRGKLPYVEASILELMRWKTVVPLALPHCTTRDTELDGFFIPAETTVFINLHSANMDPRCWEDPDDYRPERFLDESGNVINRELMMSFSVGRRSCLGELLARQEVFLFFTALIQQFEVLPPEGEERLEVVDKFVISLSPSHYTVRFVPRHPPE